MPRRRTSPAIPLLLAAAFAASLTARSAAHSQMSDPQSFSPKTCRLGGIPPWDKEGCAGPCNRKALDKGFANFDSPDNPARTYRRGQAIAVKYQRNNHGPGGFVRLSLVPVASMMSKAVHTRNAFHHSCWGSMAVRAKASELGKDAKKFSLVGNDGTDHRFATAYYETRAKIPDCVPDGKYVMGWVWYGGTGSVVTTSAGTQRPLPYGFFGDYYSCSFVHVRGGAPLRATCRARFVNDMTAYSAAGCMSANNRPGICAREPCRGVIGKYQRPHGFGPGRAPLLKKSFFGGGGGSGGGPSSGPRPGGGAAAKKKMNACRCLGKGRRCSKALARKTAGKCRYGVTPWKQWRRCKTACCAFCRPKRNAVCNAVRAVCARL